MSHVVVTPDLPWPVAITVSDLPCRRWDHPSL